MSYGLSDGGETALLADYFADNTVELGVYNDNTDNLADSDSVGAITTEPGGSNYARASVSGSEVTVSLSNGSGLLDIATQSLDVSDSTQNVDSWFLYNSNDGFFMRGAIDTSNYANNYINLANLDADLLVGGDALTLE